MTRRAGRLDGMAVSPILAIGARVARMRADGQDVIDLTIGEPEFDTPEPVKAAAREALARGDTKYTALTGTPALKAAVVGDAARDGIAAGPANVIACAGAKQVLFNAFMATLEPGDEVVVPTPAWASYGDIVRIAGGVPVSLPCEARDGFRPDPAALSAAIGPRTRWVMFNSPGNPTGAVIDAARCRALLDVVAPHPDVLVLADDIYRHLIFDGAFATPAALRPDLSERILTVNGVSKSHAMTGWRLGWGIGPEWLVAAMAVVQSQSTSCPSSVSQAAAVEALRTDDGLTAWRDVYRRRRDLFAARIEAIPGLTLAVVPQGAFYAFPSCEAALVARDLESDVAMADGLLTEARVAAVPGVAFEAPGHLRFSTAASEQALEAALDRMQQWFDS